MRSKVSLTIQVTKQQSEWLKSKADLRECSVSQIFRDMLFEAINKETESGFVKIANQKARDNIKAHIDSVLRSEAN